MAGTAAPIDLAGLDGGDGTPKVQSRGEPQTRGRRVLLGALTPALLLVLWEISSRANLVTPLILPSPETVYSAFLSLVNSGDLAANLSISIRRVVSGFAAGALLGLALGASMGLSPRFERFLRPSFLAVAQIPTLAWIPFLMILFGIGETLKIVIIAEAALVPTTLNTLDGFRNIPKAYLEVARIYKFNRRQILRKIMLPGALLPVFTGLRYGLTHAWQSLVVVELLASTEGIGYQMVMARQLFQLDVMIATMAVIGIIGFILDKLLALGEMRLSRRYGAAA
ncbi:MAG: ABC transporter permease [Parvibaculaceae bacterium]|nr:ABC transporter permease [Parvibaculaceae bacterium]